MDPQGGYAQQSQGYQQQTPQARYAFTPDEVRALRECNRESFYYRCLPLGAAFSGATYFAIKAGYLTASARFGPAPKMFFAATVGYFLGKLSYQKKCVEKILALPNSPLGDMIRKNKAGGSTIGFSEALSLEPSFSTVTGTTYTGDISEPRTLDSNLFTDVGDSRPMESFDSNPEHYPKAFENEQQMETKLPPKSSTYLTSYDELRKQNREDYDRRLHPSQYESPTRPTPRTNVNVGIHQEHQQPPQYPPQAQGPPVKKNIYGDAWE